MPLLDTTKSALANLATLLSLDPSLCLAVHSSAEHLLSPADAATVFAILGRDPNGTSLATGQANLATIAADVAGG